MGILDKVFENTYNAVKHSALRKAVRAMFPDDKQTCYDSEALCEDALLPVYEKWVSDPKKELLALNAGLVNEGGRDHMLGLKGYEPLGTLAISGEADEQKAKKETTRRWYDTTDRWV